MEYIYRVHAIERMFQRDIYEHDVEEVIKNGEIIEHYVDDKPYASFLVLGVTLITAYRPSTNKWQDDFRSRKG